MPFTARFSKTFLKKYQKLPENIKPRMKECIREILVKPDVGIMLVGSLRGLWKSRVGKYRIIYEFNEKENIVVFYNVELRKKVYNR